MVSMAGIVLVFYFWGSSTMRNLNEMTWRLLSLQYGKEPFGVMRFAVIDMFRILMPFFAATVIFAISSSAAQGGFVVRPLKFEPGKLNPVSGFKRIFSAPGLIEFMKSLAKFVVGGILFYIIIKDALPLLPMSSAMDLKGIQDMAAGLIVKAFLYAFVTFLVIALLDYLNERWKFSRSLRMTREEIKTEHKETDGDPLIKSRIKSLQKEMARKRMMQEVPKAAVVITNPTHLAVALRYEKGEMAAPRIVAKGAGHIAEKIKEVAAGHRIPLVEDKPLARALFKLKTGSYIPEELYRAVARILAYIYKLKGAA